MGKKTQNKTPFWSLKSLARRRGASASGAAGGVNWSYLRMRGKDGTTCSLNNRVNKRRSRISAVDAGEEGMTLNRLNGRGGARLSFTQHCHCCRTWHMFSCWLFCYFNLSFFFLFCNHLFVADFYLKQAFHLNLVFFAPPPPPSPHPVQAERLVPLGPDHG